MQTNHPASLTPGNPNAAHNNPPQGAPPAPQYTSPQESNASSLTSHPPEYSSPVEAQQPAATAHEADDLYDAPPPSHPPPQYESTTQPPPEKAPHSEAATHSDAGPSIPPPPPQYDNPNAVEAAPEKPDHATSAAAPSFPPPPTQAGALTEVPPPKPPRPGQAGPPQRRSLDAEGGQYIRDPHKLVAYLVPFPQPEFKKGLFHSASGSDVPQRFLIYTPPPPPLAAPPEGEKEGKIHKLQRKWQNEVREAKTSDAKVASWKGMKGRATKGINWAINQTTTSNLDFINRMGGNEKQDQQHDKHADDGHPEGETTKKTVGLEELVLVYPEGLPGSEEEIRTEFVNNMLRTKSKAQKDAVIATGLMPVAFAIDMLATLVWPFGGLVEIDGVWAASSIRGAKTARGVTKRLNSTGDADKEEAKLHLSFTPSPRIDILQKYLQEECHKRDGKYFKSPGVPPSETEVLDAMGWTASAGAKNWEDEQWETREVKDDLKATMHKGAREWDKWVKTFEKDPKKAEKK